MLVAVIVTAGGAFRRPGAAAAAGIALAAVAVLALTVARSPVAGMAAFALVGVGSGIFSTHVGPLILGGAPATHLARVQSVLVLVQSVPLLLTLNVLGRFADLFTVDVALLACAVFLLVSAGFGISSPVLRTATLAGAAADPPPGAAPAVPPAG